MYERYSKIRDAKGYKDADVSRGTGIGKSTFSDWKNGRSVPKTPKLKAIANFLNVNLTDITSEDDIEYDLNTNTWEMKPDKLFTGLEDRVLELEKMFYIDEKTKELANFLHNNPEYQVLFDASKKVKPDDIERALKAIGLFIDEE